MEFAKIRKITSVPPPGFHGTINFAVRHGISVAASARGESAIATTARTALKST
jgi:hypothetical protein